MNEQHKENQKAKFEDLLILWGFEKKQMDYEKRLKNFVIRVDNLLNVNEIRIYVKLNPFSFFLPQIVCSLDNLNDTLKDLIKFLNHT